MEYRHSFHFGGKNNTTPLEQVTNQNMVITNLNENAIERKKANQKSDNIIPDKYNLYRPKLMVDLNFAKRLRQAQNNTAIPLVNDIVASWNNNIWEIIIIINNGNTMNSEYNGIRSANVELFVGNKKYHNTFLEVKEVHLRVLKYEVPILPVSGSVSLFDHSTNERYLYLPYKALIRQPRRRMAICAYISNYNTINEIKSFLAFNILQKVDNVILYCALHCEYFMHALKKEIESGFVILYEYPWPLTKKYGAYHRSIQGSQINSCYYRHRNYYEYIISQDVDEYFYSEQYPYDLYTAIRKTYELNPDRRSLAAQSFLYLGNASREISLKNGTLFDDFNIRMDNKYSGRRKQVIDTRAEGYFYVHDCYYCYFGRNVPINLLRIAHFKKNIRYNQSTEVTHTLSKYTRDMINVVTKLHS